jgi:hypothetical protein
MRIGIPNLKIRLRSHKKIQKSKRKKKKIPNPQECKRISLSLMRTTAMKRMNVMKMTTTIDLITSKYSPRNHGMMSYSFMSQSWS